MEKVISKDGTSIAFGKTGKGPSLVLVDGAFCYSKYGNTPGLVPLLSDYFTVYYYDRRGRGESSDTDPYSVDNEVWDLKKIIDKTGEEPFICGFSSGASLIIHLIGKGVKVKKIALFEPPYVATSSYNTIPPEDAATKLNSFVRLNKRDEAVKYFMTKVMGMPAIFVFLLKQFGKSIWEENKSVANTLSYDVAIMGSYSVPKQIAASINVPTLVIGGEKSSGNLRQGIEDVAKEIPQSQIKWLRGQKHNVSMEILAPCLINFFNP